MTTMKSYRLIFLLLIIFCNICNAQVFQNMGFEDTCDTSKSSFCYWDIGWINNNVSCTSDKIDNNTIAFIQSSNPNGIGFIQQTALVKPGGENRILSFSGKIKTESLMGKGASLNITIEDKDGNNLFTENMFNSELSGTNNWKECTLKVICAEQAYKVKIGAIVYGEGKAWFDDFKLNEERIDKNLGKKEISYIENVSKIIAKYSLRKDSVDLVLLKKQALALAGNSSGYFLLHLATQFYIKSLGDHHSFLIKPNDLKNWEAGDKEAHVDFANYRIIDSCAYIFVPQFFSLNKKLALAYADTINKAIQFLSNSNIKGWVIDLRMNLGGNMHPMIAGLGPLFDNELLGQFVDVNGKKDSWSYKKGYSYVNKYKQCTVKNQAVLTKHLPIAVLIGNNTGSSGEFTALSFVGNKNTKLFGQASYGATTGNDQFKLDDGAMLMLTTTIGADRTGKLYGGTIIPDVVTKEIAGEDNTLYTAIDWLKGGGK